jgi:hypothetical protein
VSRSPGTAVEIRVLPCWKDEIHATKDQRPELKFAEDVDGSQDSHTKRDRLPVAVKINGSAVRANLGA